MGAQVWLKGQLLLRRTQASYPRGTSGHELRSIMMGNRFLASMALFIVASADKIDAEPARVNAPGSLCLLQTKAVKGEATSAENRPDEIAELQMELDADALLCC